MHDEEGIGILPDEPEMEIVPVQDAPEEVQDEVNKLAEDAWAPETTILILKTQVGQERRVADSLTNKAKKFNVPILSILSPQELRGYLFVETSDIMGIEKGIRGVSYARSLVSRDMEVRDENGNFTKDRRGKIITERKPVETPFGEIQHFLTPVSAVAKIAEGNLVELVSGPFRGEKAKVTRVDDAREEITVELIDSMVPIPITVKGENVRVLERDD
jgi:transcriptional antiterminator NusG